MMTIKFIRYEGYDIKSLKKTFKSYGLTIEDFTESEDTISLVIPINSQDSKEVKRLSREIIKEHTSLYVHYLNN